MLIIFDLDDTLVKTSDCITYILLERSLRAMVNKGFKTQNFNQALFLLRELNKQASNAEEALKKFIIGMRENLEFINIGKEQLTNFTLDMPIFPLELAVETLCLLKRKKHSLCLVTIGKDSLQRQKLEKAGIDPILFSKIVVSEDRNKKPHYERLLAEFGYSPEQVMVCGDRISVDLEPAIQLNCKTVHMLCGRGLNSKEKTSKAKITYRISSLVELGNLRELR
ncbi:HAD family hydrolase [Candidatus Rhabdochlamydia porcellionis]|uniref:Haloacid dehalogenase-like hydrolase n=1 Tax=Candidatus Rhabdochlamydia porcellionis TaxID=225148 RepID=A0ABX8Z3D0_9BACT|nr:HAD family hydrolase [Candidatus Rhabdochlamydia porcellionis]QZA59042.1 Haloacid dehalogenase-like hydrolase [Candidatus Rhabdochlamydia porcellionis]